MGGKGNDGTEQNDNLAPHKVTPMAPMQSRKVAFLLSSLKFGGGERVALNLAAELKATGWQVDFLLMSNEGDFLAEAESNFSVVNLNCDATWKLPIRLSAYLIKFRPHVLISSYWKLNLCACLARIFYPPVKLLLWEHSPPSESTNSPIWLYAISSSLFYPLSTGIVAVSSGVFNDIGRITLGLQNKMRVIFNPIAPPDSSIALRAPHEKSKKIIWVGRMDEPKNPALMLEAFSLLPDLSSYTLDFVGDGKLRPELERLCESLGMQDRVFFRGFQTDPYFQMSKSDLLVLTSDCEGLGNVIIEAMYCGLRVVSTDCGEGIHDILLDNQYGEIVPVNDKVALAAAIQRELQTPFNAQEQIEGAKRFLPGVVARQFIAAIDGN